MARSLSQLFYALGGSVSPGESNDELIDHLIDAEFIRTPAIQRVFRSVDRGNYYHPNHRHNAYQDLAWKKGNLHLSAPCVYSVVMESLKLKPGHSFLNIGSGSGYLSTMAGLLLGEYGINHGIEFYEDIVDYAYEKLDEFLKNSKVVDEHDFCEPVFTCGNCLTLDSNVQQYDRVYCGAACPEEYENYIKNLVKINGILIMPLNDKLLKMTRVSDNDWNTVKVLSVSFQPLIVPPATKKGEIVNYSKLSDIKPPTLQQLCRFKIRAHLRNNIEAEHPKLKDIAKKLPSQRSGLKFFFFQCNSDDEEIETSDSDAENLDSFMLFWRNFDRRRHLLRSVNATKPCEQNESEEEEEIENVLKFASLTTVRDGAEVEEEDQRRAAKRAKKAGESTETKTESEFGDVSSKSEMITESGSSGLSFKIETKAESGSGDISSKSETERRSRSEKKVESGSGETSKGKTNPKTGKRGKSAAEAGNSSSSIETGESISSNTRSKLEKNKGESFDLPPSRSTRSKTLLKRKLSSMDDGPSTSAGPSSSTEKKGLGKFAAKKQKTDSSENKKKPKESFARTVKLDSDNKVTEEFSHSYFLTQKIAALPLPMFLRKFMNYKRDNF